MISALYWLLTGLVMMVLEVFIPGLIIIFFGLGAIVVAGLTFLGITTSLALQLLVWVVSSLVFVLALRRQTAKIFPALEKKEETADDMVDETGVTLGVVDGKSESGRVRVQGTTWKALSHTGEIIAEGVQIRVVRRENLTVYVEPLR